MELAFGIDVDVRCLGCSAPRDLPEGADRVIEGDALYADAATACECGTRRVRVCVTVATE